MITNSGDPQSLDQTKSDNLFTALSRYGSSQPENYLTEAFVHVLRTLSTRAAAEFLSVIMNLSGLADQDLDINSHVVLSTQSGLPEGRPDIRMDFGDDRIVFVEVKDWSPLSEGQLEKYYAQIQELYGSRGKLVLLTRSRQSRHESELDPSLYHHICWYEVYSWLHGLDIADEPANHYVSEFTAFLEGKAMGVQKVTWEYENGIRSMLILTNLLETAISEALPDSATRHTAGWSWRGLYVDEEYFLGSRFDEPNRLVFENNQGTNPTFKVDLLFKDVHFHSLSAGEQLETITEFIKSAVEESGARSNLEGSP